MSESSVLIVGAGPTGLTMACELSRYGIPFDIIDKLPERSDKSKALAVHARSLEVLYDMGCSDRFLEEGILFKSFSAHSDGKQLIHFSLSEIDSPFPFALGIQQSTTEALLAEHLATFGKDVRRGCELTAIEEEDGCVRVTLKSAEGEGEHKYKWVVACDGAHSAVRKCFGEPYEASGTEEGFLVADVIADWGAGKSQPDPVCAFSSKNGMAAFFAMPGDHCRVIANVPIAKVSSSPTLDEVQTEVGRAMGDSTPKFSDPQWLTGFCVRYRQVEHYRIGHVFFCGDAAHIHSPVGGQGMNTGIQDAYNLAWKLAFACKGKATDALVDSYHNERHTVGKELLKQTDMMTKVNVLKNPIALEVRNRLAPILAAQEVMQNRMRAFISETGISYRHSPVVCEHKHNLVKAAVRGGQSEEPSLAEWFAFSNGPRAGDRALDAGLRLPDDSETSVHTMLRGTKHVLFLLSGGNAPAEEIRAIDQVASKVEERFADLISTVLVVAEPQWLQHVTFKGIVLTDPDYSMHHRYGAGSSCLYLVRPDNYIGMRSQPADVAHVEEYLKSIISL